MICRSPPRAAITPLSGQTGKLVPGGPFGGQAPGFDTRHAHSAGVCNYWLGAKDNCAAGREAAEQAIAANPGIVTDVRANRAFLAWLGACHRWLPGWLPAISLAWLMFE